MKKLLAITGLLAVASLAHAQGFIDLASTAAGITTTNTATLTSGKIAITPSGYYFALLASATPPATSLPTDSGWAQVTQSGGAALAYNNGNALAGSTTGTGSSGGVAINWASGTAISVEVVGWSASLGTSLSTVLAQYQSGNWNANGYFGFTGIGSLTPFATSGAGDPTLFPGSYPNGSLQLTSVFVPSPEPGTIALAGLGGLALLGLRRKKA